MRADELIKLLSSYPAETLVFAFDADTGEAEPVSGVTFSPAMGAFAPMAQLCTDDTPQEAFGF